MKLRKPMLNLTSLDPADLAQLAPEARLDQVILSDLDASGMYAGGMSFDEALLEKVLLVAAKLEKLSLSDVELKACDFSAADCSDGSLIRVRSAGGRLTGVDLSRSVLQDVTFEDCKLDMANFRFARLTRVQFINCSLQETDFQAAELHEVEFQSCHLEKVEFAQCKIDKVDAHTSQLHDIRGWQSLKGLVIDSTQLITIAPQLAAQLGLVVKEG